MLRKLALIVAVVSSCRTAFSQQATTSPGQAVTYIGSTAIPDTVLFRYFFLHVTRLQQAADTLEAQGKDGQSMRGLIQKQAHLTDNEAALVTSLSASCLANYTAARQSGAAAVQQLMQQYPNATTRPPAVAQLMSRQSAQRDQAITDCVAALQSGMGKLRYMVLQGFVVATEGPAIKIVTPAVPPAGVVPPAKQ